MLLNTQCRRQLLLTVNFRRLSTTNWHLPLADAIYLYKDYIMLLLQLLILNTVLKGVQSENRNEALCALGKTGKTGLQIIRYFQELIL